MSKTKKFVRSKESPDNPFVVQQPGIVHAKAPQAGMNAHVCPTCGTWRDHGKTCRGTILVPLTLEQIARMRAKMTVVDAECLGLNPFGVKHQLKVHYTDGLLRLKSTATND